MDITCCFFLCCGLTLSTVYLSVGAITCYDCTGSVHHECKSEGFDRDDYEDNGGVTTSGCTSCSYGSTSGVHFKNCFTNNLMGLHVNTTYCQTNLCNDAVTMGTPSVTLLCGYVVLRASIRLNK